MYEIWPLMNNGCLSIKRCLDGQPCILFKVHHEFCVCPWQVQVFGLSKKPPRLSQGIFKCY